MQPARDLLEVLEHSRQPAADVPQAARQLVAGSDRGRHPQLQSERDEALLRPVVQVALDPPALPVGRRDDARARGGELGAALGVGDGGGDELGELGDP